MGYGERFQKLRKALGFTLREFGEQLNMSHGHISDIEHERKILTDRLIELLNLKYNVRKDWLVDGTGEMFAVITRDEKIAAFMGDALSDENETFKKRFLSMLSNLSIEEWELLEKKVIELAKENE